jgi:hypothetical protein
MTVAQIHSMYNLTVDHGLGKSKKVNFTMWKNQLHVTLSFMNRQGVVWRYTIEPDGSYEGEESA